MAGLTPQCLQYPFDDTNCITGVTADFYNIANIPNAYTAKPPTEDKASYVNRKEVCGAHLCLVNVVVRWPVSTHDSFIWKKST